MRRRISAMAVVFTVCASMVAAAQGDPTAPGFSDGRWLGTVHYRASLTGDNVQASTQLSSGTFEVVWSGGAPSGTLSASGTGTVRLTEPAGQGQLTLDYLGSFGGLPDAPLVEGQSLAASGSVTVDGLTVPVSFTLGPGEIGTAPLDIVAASCTLVSGNFESAIADANAALAGTATVTPQVAFWSASRAPESDLTADQQAELADMLAAADAFDAAVATGSFN
ncbi:MAG: hypothetical protein AAFY28_08340, partial [Actinomycetota bacterium]